MEELIRRYIEILKSEGDSGEVYKWEAINHFQDHWDIEAEDFKEMFTIALQHTGNLLYHNSRSYILTLAEYFPEEVRSMFRHLYNEGISLEERIPAFRKAANDLLPKVKKAIDSDNLATHQDERSTSVYLAFRFPEKYYLYKASFYRKLCEQLDVPVKKARKRLLHYLELAEEIKDKYITNNTELQELSAHIYPETKWNDDNLLTQNFLYNMLDKKENQSEATMDTNRKYWLFAPGSNASKFEEFYNLGEIGIGWDKIGNLSEYKSRDEIQDALLEAYPGDTNKRNDTTANWEFANEMNIGDVVIAKEGLNILLGYGEITSEYYFDSSALEFKSRRKIEWKIKGEWKVENNLVLKTLTDITGYPADSKEFDTFYEKLMSKMTLTRSNLKKEFIQWLIDSPDSSYFNNDAATLERYLDIYNSYFDIDLFMVSARNYQNIITEIEAVYEDKDSEFYKYSERESSHRARAILGRRNYIKFLKEKFSVTKKSFSDNNKSMNFPLNQILYGPPGTGKTYQTLEMSLEVCGINTEGLSREKMKLLYNELVKDGRIVFTTFHQSTGYEDFIEGIKPLEPEKEGGNIIYKVVDGVFKDLVTKAKIPSHLSFDDAYKKLISSLSEDPESILDLKTPTGRTFGVTVNKNESLNLHTGESKGIQGTLTKENILKEINGELKFVGWEGYYKGVINHLMSECGYKNENSEEEKNYVLIIDEINRGNVSAIFGELITLIEPDKRLGAENEIKVRLPYSKTDFGVPSNIDIYGTMNTADRSVEALDTALRRRFSFKEVMPNPSLLTKIAFDDFTLEEVLISINERIEFLLDRDHTIGHSYFMNVKSGDTEALKEVFKNKVIPLLQEYFYHDYEKIALVLGPGFVEVKPNHLIKFPTFDGILEPDTVTLCELIEDTEEEELDIEDAVQKLLNKNA